MNIHDPMTIIEKAIFFKLKFTTIKTDITLALWGNLSDIQTYGGKDETI